MDNEESSYTEWLEQTEYVFKQEDGDIDAARNTLSDLLETHFEFEVPELTGVYADLLGAAMSSIDWREIATSLLKDHQNET